MMKRMSSRPSGPLNIWGFKMNNKLKLIASIAFAVALFFGASQTVNAQYGNHCYHSGYPAYRASYGYGYGYSNPYPGYSSYAAYPAYSTYYAPRVYSGTSLYVGPGYTTARVVVPQYYPAYRPAVVATPYGPMPGVRIGF